MTELIYKNEEKSVLGTVSNIRYYHQAAAWNSPLSFGVQAFIEYNGLIMNDRYQSDLIRVTKITGLDDAEIRDSREPKPSESGEFPYAAYYGGRNLVISGFIEAGSLAAKETLVSRLKAAFAPLEESQLKFRWFDIFDSFDDPYSILEYNPNASLAGIPSGNYIPLIGSLNNLKIEGGLLRWSTASKIYLIRCSEKRTFCDLQMTMRCITGSFDTSYIGFILCAKNSENYLFAKYYQNEENPELIIESITNNESTVLISERIYSSLRTIEGQSFWLRGRKEGNEAIIEYYLEEPNENNFPSFSKTIKLTGTDEANYGNEILSEVGIGGNQVNTNWSFGELKIESLYPGDVEFKARKISPLSIPDEQTSLTKFKRPFQITMKTSDFRVFSSTEISRTIFPTNNSNTPVLGRSYPRRYPLAYRTFTSQEFPSNENVISINNRGTCYVEPILYLYGFGENVLIENLTNGNRLEWLGTVALEDYIKFDCKEKEITNSLGSNFIKPLVPTTEWIRIEPGWNDIYIQLSSLTEGDTKFVVKCRHGYM